MQPDPILGDKFADALAYAVELHGQQARKGTAIPYLTHVLAVSSLVLEDGGSEVEALAALLHDGPEDCGGEPILAEVRRQFGDAVAEIVRGLSDSMTAVGEEKEDWRPRKTAYLARLSRESRSVLRVSLADKLHNARSIAVDHANQGDEIWKRFNSGRDDQAWYFKSLLAIYESRASNSRNLPLFRLVVDELFGA